MDRYERVLIVLLLLGGALGAGAQVTAPATTTTAPKATPALSVEVQGALERGLALLKEEKWEQASAVIGQSRPLAPENAALLRAMADAEAHMPGRELRAMVWYGAYLAARPGAPDIQDVRKVLAELQVRHEGDVTRLLEQMHTAVTNLPATARNRQALFAQQEIWEKRKNWDLAMAAALAQSESNDLIVGQFLLALQQAHAGEFDLALKTFAGAQGTKHPWYAMNQRDMAVVIGRAGKFQLALDIVAQMRPGSDRDEALQEIAAAQTVAGDMAGAQETLTLIRGEKEKRAAMVIIARAQAKKGDMPGALKTLAGIPAGPSNDTRPYGMGRGGPVGSRPIDYRSDALLGIIRVLVEAGDLAGAGKLAEAMDDAYERSQAQREIAYGQIRAGDMAGARKTVAAMYTSALAIREAYLQRVELSGVTALQVQVHEGPGFVRVMTAQGDLWGSGQQLKDLMKDVVVEPADFDEVTALVEKVAVPALQEMMRARLALCQAQTGKLDGALKTIAAVGDMPMGTEAREAIATLQAQRGDYAGALATAQKIGGGDIYRGGIFIQTIAEMQARAGDIPGALRTVRGISTHSISEVAVGAVGLIQVEKGDIAGALATAELIEEKAPKANVLTAAAQAQFKAGDKVAGRRTLEQALALAGQSEPTWRATEALLNVFECQRVIGDEAGAAASIKKALEISQTSVGGLLIIARHQARANDIAGAIATANKITPPFFSETIRCYLDIALIQLAAGDLNGSKNTIESIPPAPPTPDYPREYVPKFYEMHATYALALADAHAYEDAWQMLHRDANYGPWTRDVDKLRQHIAAARLRPGVPPTLPVELPKLPDSVAPTLPPSLEEYVAAVTGKGQFNTPRYLDFKGYVKGIAFTDKQQFYNDLLDAYQKDQEAQREIQALLEVQLPAVPAKKDRVVATQPVGL